MCRNFSWGFVTTWTGRGVWIMPSGFQNKQCTCTVTTAAMESRPLKLPAILRPQVPSPDLAKVVGDHAMPRSSVVKKISEYAKRKGLQDQSNMKNIILDTTLRQIFRVNSCTFLEISKHIAPHLRDARDVGGKYVKEARKYEEDWIAKKQAEATSKPKLSREQLRQQRLSKAKEEQTGVYAPVVLSDELSAICQGKKEMTRQDVIKAVWHYIRMNNLNSRKGDGGIRTDFLLRRVFNSDTIRVTDVMRAVSRHVTKKPEV